MTDTQKKDLILALTNACDSLATLEEASNDAQCEIESQARSMLDDLEHHLRMLTPMLYVS